MQGQKTLAHKYIRGAAIAVVVSVGLASIIGSGAPNQRPSTSPPTSTAQSSVTHLYELTVKDISGRGMPDVSVQFIDKDGGKASCKTNQLGVCSYQLIVYRDPKYTYTTSYESSVSYEIEKEGYYTAKGKMSSYYGSSAITGKRTETKEVTLKKPEDYLDPAFNSAKKYSDLRNKTLKFISLIRLQGFIVDTDLVIGGVGMVDFKSKNYLRFKFETDTSYNSLKLNKYDIAKRIFDDSIRKLLNPLNENISDPKLFFGYDMLVNGYTKDFSEKYATPKKIEYRFLMPQDAVRRYKQKDISGQQLLDASVILMNDERIELKLQ